MDEDNNPRITFVDSDDSEHTALSSRARRFSPAFKLFGMGGATARRWPWASDSQELFLSCSTATRRHDYRCSGYTSRLNNEGKQDLGFCTPGDISRPLTRAELELGLPIKDDPITINKDRRWEAIAELFEGGADVEGDDNVLHATLEPQAALVHRMGRAERERKAFAASLQSTIFLRPRHVLGGSEWLELSEGGRRGRRVLRKLTVLYDPSALELARHAHPAVGPSLLELPALAFSASSCGGSFSCSLSSVTTARRHDSHYNAWAPTAPTRLPRANAASTRPQAWLQVDLGVDCAVSAVGTRGRFPRVRQYPPADVMREMGLDPRHCRRWARIMVGEPSGEWVTKYALWARRDGGRAWTRVGVFDANTDETTEALVDVAALSGTRATHGLLARYLRFEPLEFHGRVALRVGVYGSPLGEHLARGGRSRGAPDDERAASTELSSDGVRYSLSGGALTASAPRTCSRAALAQIQRFKPRDGGGESAPDGAAHDDEDSASATAARARVRARRRRQQLYHHSIRDDYSWGSSLPPEDWANFLFERSARRRRVFARNFCRLSGRLLRDELDDVCDGAGDDDDDDAGDLVMEWSEPGSAPSSTELDLDVELAWALQLSLLEMQASATRDEGCDEAGSTTGASSCADSTVESAASCVLVDWPTTSTITTHGSDADGVGGIPHADDASSSASVDDAWSIVSGVSSAAAP